MNKNNFLPASLYFLWTMGCYIVYCIVRSRVSGGNLMDVMVDILNIYCAGMILISLFLLIFKRNLVHLIVFIPFGLYGFYNILSYFRIIG